VDVTYIDQVAETICCYACERPIYLEE